MGFVLNFICLFATAVAFGAALSPVNQKNTHRSIEEMLGYHVEYKDFSTLLVKRSIKIFFEQFDPNRVYLLQQEVSSFLDMGEKELKDISISHKNSEYTVYEQIDEMIGRSIQRARQYRNEISKQLIEQEGVVLESLGGSFSKTEEELQKNIQKMLVAVLEMERKAEKLEYLTKEDKENILNFFERRIRKTEEGYLAQDEGRALSMHIMKAFAKSLDAHTCFFTPEEAFDLKMNLEKEFEGIGVVFREGVRGITIKSLVAGGPAERTGKLQSGDRLVAINGKSIEGVSYSEAMQWLKEDKKGRVSLTVEREPGGRVSVDLVREKIVLNEERVQYTVHSYGDGIIGVIHLPSFYEGGSGMSAEEDMRQALRELKAKGNLRGVVLDVRDNTGGFLSQAVKVGGLFITSGVIVISKYAEGQMQYLRELDGRMFYEGPLVILTSKLSASATEIVAQALQDYGIAVVVGDHRTYGKGTIQYQTVTKGDAKAYFKVTMGRYYTVSGRSTQIEGVKADIVVPTKYAPFNIGEKYLLYPLKNDQVLSAFFDPCMDVDPRHLSWFQKNYLPNLQKKLSCWTEMLPVLKRNSESRLQNDIDFLAFFDLIKNRPQSINLEESSIDDLQLKEAVCIVKDMSLLQKNKKQENFLLK